MSDEERLKISPKSKKQKMILSTEADTAIVGGAMGCLDGETEYLSESGWVKISDYTEGTVAQYNPDENIIEFVDPSLYIKKPTDHFYHIKANYIDQMVTDNHTVVYWKDQSSNYYNLPASVISEYGDWSGYLKTTDKLGNFVNVPVSKKNIKKIECTDSLAYCFTVPSGMLVIRRNGHISITGNSGKSYMALLFPLKYSEDQYFRGIIFRKTTGEIEAQGGLWETALEMYSYVFGRDKLKVNMKKLKITFPTGASLKFSHMEHDNSRLQHQGAQYTFVLFDEATHFSQLVIEYLMLRIRSARAQHKKQMILTCNPDPDWFALEWIRPYLQEDGTPNQLMDGVISYYAVVDGKYTWARNRRELEEIYGTGDESGIKTFTFISATCYDNPVLLKNDPTYISTLKAKPFVDVQRYLYGNWFVRPSSSGMLKRDWLTPISWHKAEITSYCRAWDIAGVLPSDAYPNPDWTVGVLMGRTRTNRYVVCDVVRFRARVGEVIQRIIEVGREDPTNTYIVVPQEPGQAGIAAGQDMINTLLRHGVTARMRPTNTKKVKRFEPFSAAAEAYLIDYVKAEWNDDYFKELEAFTGIGKSGKDDQVDATSDAFIVLSRKVTFDSSFLHGVKNTDLSNKSGLLQIGR